MCKTAALMLEAVRVGAGLEPCAFWGSWCILKALLADFRSNSSLVVMMRTVGPSGGSKSTGMIAPVAPSESAAIAARLMELQEAAGCSSHS